jgi:cell division protein FtsB
MAYSVRWDRLGRIALLVVLAGVIGLYIGPAYSYWQTWRESRARNAELSRLEAEHARLVARRRALREPASLMHEARRLGMVRRGERAFVVQDLPR